MLQPNALPQWPRLKGLGLKGRGLKRLGLKGLGLKGLGLTLLLLSPLATVHAEAPAAGTVISNQASASFKSCIENDCSRLAERQSVTSNLVETTIQAVPSFTFESSQLKPGVNGEAVSFPHTLNNTGNVEDSYALCVANVAGSVTDWAVYLDEDNNGQPDSGVALFDSNDADTDGCWTSTTRVVDAGEQYDIVVEAVTTGTAGDQLDILDITATSTEAPSLSQTNTDSVRFPDGPVIDVVKSLSDNKGLAGSGPHTVSLRYRNTSTQTATDLVIEDSLPTQHRDINGALATGGMEYVTGSASWSLDAGVTLTDDATDGDQTVAGEAIAYCAYQPSSPDCDDRIRATIDTVPPGAEATLTFEVNIAEGIPASSVITNIAGYRYSNADGTQQFGASGAVAGTDPAPSVFDTNTATFTITDKAQNPAVVANNSSTSSALGADDTAFDGNEVVVTSVPQGGTAVFDNYVWNTGDGTDTFDITLDKEGSPIAGDFADQFPPGTLFNLLRSDGATPMTDSTGSGTLDTGAIPVPDVSGNCPERFVSDGSACGVKVVLAARLPSDFTWTSPNDPISVTKQATSNARADVTNVVVDRLEEVLPSAVDITNNASLTNDSNAPGVGQGAEETPVTTNSDVAPGSTTVFNLFINNTSGRQSSYTLSVSDTVDPSFVDGQLPEGWQVGFYHDGGNGDCSTLGEAISATPLVPANGSQQVCAEVSVPENAVGGTEQSLYFRAQSQSANTQDIKHDQVVVSSGPAISLTPDQSAQALPGKSVVYTHQIVNTGNVALEQVALSATPADDGWTLVFFEDDGDGEWGPGDTQRNEGDALSTADGDSRLDPGEEITVFVRVFVPANTSLGDVNIKTVAVDAETVTDATPVSDTATDTTTANNSDIVITKRQALDAACDGTADAAFVFTGFQVAPGECVIYELEATNQGAESMNNVTISDRTQPYTVYQANALSCTSPDNSCTVTDPADGATGPIDANAGTLAPGEQATLIFGLEVQ